MHLFLKGTLFSTIKIALKNLQFPSRLYDFREAALVVALIRYGFDLLVAEIGLGQIDGAECQNAYTEKKYGCLPFVQFTFHEETPV